MTSPGPESVAVTIYRDPDARPGDDVDLRWLQGYALISERRTITLPAGRATIRFEGVAQGALPETAIVTGLPAGVREKNLDADLLSPRSLYTRSLNRPVTIRRMLGGKMVEERAIIRSGPDGAAVVETKEGFIAADCRPHTDEIVYDSVPAGLSAKPTLSIDTEAPESRQVTVTLTYLAWGFDWQAHYVATMRPDGKSADLFAWVTLANSDVTSFVDAETMVIAGDISRETWREQAVVADFQPLWFRCLSTVVVGTDGVRYLMRNSSTVVDSITAEDIGAFPDANMAEALQRVPGVAMVRQEELGDLKLYRVPERTTVAAMSQKQVALLDREAVPVEVIYRVQIFRDTAQPTMLVLRAQNRKETGLGMPLPAGKVAVFEPLGPTSALIGEGTIADKAVGEEVEVEVVEATQVVAKLKEARSGKRWSDQLLTVTNANPFAVRFEAELVADDEHRLVRPSAKLGRRRGRDAWIVEVPANGTVTLRYRSKQVRRR
ncbi:MAG: hypothetical protein V4574_21140 [Pseudomonadota bacterium]